MSVDDVTEILAVDLIGTLLDDEQIVIATNQESLFLVKILRQRRNTGIFVNGLWARKFPLQNSDRRKVCFRDCLKDIDIQVIISYAK